MDARFRQYLIHLATTAARLVKRLTFECRVGLFDIMQALRSVARSKADCRNDNSTVKQTGEYQAKLRGAWDSKP